MIKKAKRGGFATMIVPWSLIGTAVLGTAGGVWYARDFIQNDLASKDEVTITAAKADYVLDQTMKSMLAEINRLEAKKSKSADDREQLRYLREELERQRQIRKGK